MTVELLVFGKASKVYNRISSTHNKSQSSKNRSMSIYIYTYTSPVTTQTMQNKFAEDEIWFCNYLMNKFYNKHIFFHVFRSKVWQLGIKVLITTFISVKPGLEGQKLAQVHVAFFSLAVNYFNLNFWKTELNI